jgi:hypothetical protein
MFFLKKIILVIEKEGEDSIGLKAGVPRPVPYM